MAIDLCSGVKSTGSTRLDLYQRTLTNDQSFSTGTWAFATKITQWDRSMSTEQSYVDTSVAAAHTWKFVLVITHTMQIDTWTSESIQSVIPVMNRPSEVWVKLSGLTCKKQRTQM